MLKHMQLGSVLQRLRRRPSVPLFAGEVWDADLARSLSVASPEELFDGRAIVDAHAVGCVVAGLHLWNDGWDAAHNLCQGIATPTGSYWHGICHRREGHRGEGLAANLGNARYWFRRVGPHPVHPALYQAALAALDNVGTGFRWATEASGLLRQRGEWDPGALVDWFGQADAGTLSAQSQAVLEDLQRREIELLTEWCMRQAAGE